jgi:hypothetical protein
MQTDPEEGERFAHGLRQTWELELVISGAVAFALLQLPSAVDQVYERIDPHLADNLAGGAFIVLYYTKLALYTLIASFMIHIVARAYWVGLVGLEAVFPRGVRWDKATSGPITRKLYQERLPSLPELITKTDDFCSMIFSFSFMVVFIFVFSIVWAGLLGLLALVISRLAFGGEHLGEIFKILALLLLAPVALAPMLDKALGNKVDPAGPAARTIRALNLWAYRALGMGLYGPIMMTLSTNIRKKAFYAVFTAAFVVVFGAFVVSILTRGGLVSLSSEVYVPGKAGENEVSPIYYEDQRAEDEVFPRIPSIQSDVVRDPYVKLFIPYYPRRHNPALRQRCPGVKPLQEEGLQLENPNESAPPAAATRQVLQCLAQIHRVTLDGQPVPGLEFQFATHPESGLRGIVGYIPAANLAPGGHLLRIEAVPKADAPKGARLPDPYLIRFWR